MLLSDYSRFEIFTMGHPDIYVTIMFISIIIYGFLFALLYGEKQAKEFKRFLEENGLDRNRYKLQPGKLFGSLFIKERKVKEKYKSMVCASHIYFATGIIAIVTLVASISYIVQTFIRIYGVSSSD